MEFCAITFHATIPKTLKRHEGDIAHVEIVATAGAATLMGAYLARRLLALVPTMLLASLIVFITIRLIPGDVIDLMLSQNDVVGRQD